MGLPGAIKKTIQKIDNFFMLQGLIHEINLIALGCLKKFIKWLNTYLLCVKLQFLIHSTCFYFRSSESFLLYSQWWWAFFPFFFRKILISALSLFSSFIFFLFRNILISLTYFFSKLFFVFLIIVICYFYIWKNIIFISFFICLKINIKIWFT